MNDCDIERSVYYVLDANYVWQLMWRGLSGNGKMINIMNFYQIGMEIISNAYLIIKFSWNEFSNHAPIRKGPRLWSIHEVRSWERSNISV